MSKLSRGALPLLASLSWLWPVPGGAQYGPAGAYPPQPQTAPPGYPSAYPGYPGGYPGGYPYGQPPQQQPYSGGSGYYPQPQARPQQPAQAPRMELELSNARPYVQQNILLSLRIISSGTLKTLDPILPQNEGLMFNRIRDPSADRRLGPEGQQEIVNTLVYLVTPMRAGVIEVPHISAQVQEEGGGDSLAVQAPQPLRLEAQPADARVNPWLPLEYLAITSNLDAPLEVRPGKPVSLILKLSATGATGSQLPTLEGLLQSPDFRVYRGKTETAGGLSQNGRHILGSRTEHYTLVPQYGGTLRLPSARLTWFNVTTGTVEHTSLPIKTLAASGKGEGLERFFGGADGSRIFPSGYASAFWLPLVGIFLLMVGYWLGVWYRDRRGTGQASAAPRDLGTGLLGYLRRRLGVLRKRLRPAPYWGRAMGRLAGWLPTPVRFWFWVRCLDPERNPGLWIRTLQFMSWRQLALSPYATLAQMAERIIEFQRGADPEQVRDLFRALDGALYGRQPLDFPRWKQALKRQVQPGLRGLMGPRPSPEALDRLPALNPRGNA